MNDEFIIRESILKLFDLLSQSYVENIDSITKQLIEVYSNQESIVVPILFDIFSSHPKIAFRKQASIGLRICIKKCFKQLDEESVQQLWNEFFQIFSSETNNELIQFILLPAIELFSQSIKSYNYGFEDFGILNFFQSFAETNFVRCLQILTEFSKESFKYEKNFYDFIINILQLSFQYQEKNEIIKEIVFLSYVLILRKEIDDDVKDEISTNLSQFFIELLTDADNFESNKINLFALIITDDVQPFKMEIIIGPIFNFLFDQDINIKYRYSIAYLLSLILPNDHTNINVSDVVSLFKTSIYISVMTFDETEDQSDPDSITMLDLIYECFCRLPDEEVQSLVASTFQCLIGQSDSEEFNFGSASLFSKLFTALMLIESAINHSVYLFINFIPKIVNFCICCLDVNHPAVQNFASSLIAKNVSIFKKHILPQITDFTSSILSKIENDDFLSGFVILQEILDEFPTEICDELFLPIYTICMKKIELSEDPRFFGVVFYSWFLLAELFRNISDEIGCNYFDEIFSMSIEIINTFYETQTQRQERNLSLLEDNNIQSIVIELIGSFSKSCSEKLENHFEDVISLLLKLLQFQAQSYFNHLTTDLSICEHILNCIKFFITYMPKSTSPYVDTFLPAIIENLKSVAKTDKDNPESLSREKNETLEMMINKLKYFSDHFTNPSINLLEKIIENFPEKFTSQEIMSDLFSIAIHFLDSISQKEVISSIDLLIEEFKLIIKLNRSNKEMDFTEIVKMFIPLINDKLTSEINNSIPSGDYDVFIRWLECINIIYIYFKVDVFEIDDEEKQTKRCIIFEIFDEFLDIAGSTYQKNGEEEKLRFVKPLHDNIENFLILIVKYFDKEDYSIFEQFIPKILNFLNEENLYFHVFAINILSSYIRKSSIIGPDLISQLFERSVKSITDDDPQFSCYFVLFLSNLRFNYKELLIEKHKELIQLIDDAISNLDVSKSECKMLVEFLIALFASIDVCLENEASLTDSQRFDWFISNLPIQYSKKHNNQIVFEYLISHFEQFPDLQNKVLALFCQIFISISGISDSFLQKEIVSEILKIIIKSNVIQNQELITQFFDGDEDDAQSFYQTMRKLFALFSE